MRFWNQRIKLLAMLLAVQVGCVGIGFFVHYRYLLLVMEPPGGTNEAALPAVRQRGQADAAHEGFGGGLLAAALLAWAWTSAVSAVAIDLIVKRAHDRLAAQRAQHEAESLRNTQSLVRTRDALIFGLAAIAESRDAVTGRHLDRVSSYASRLATAARREASFRDRLTPEFVQLVGIAAVLHDLGKVAIEDEILFKPGPLDNAERQRMQEHTTLGDRFLADIEQRMGQSPVLRVARQIALSHHERWDGTGYPQGLKGEQIPLAARIVAVVDVYEALSSLRDYKAPFSHERCVQMITEGAGTQFDPQLVAAFLKIHDSFRQFAYQYGDDVCQGLLTPTGAAAATEVAQCEGLVATLAALGDDLSQYLDNEHPSPDGPVAHQAARG